MTTIEHAARDSRADRALVRVPNNLPTQLTSFVGRRTELEAVVELMTTFRLVTVTGPGGSGKTRLAWQVAAELAARYPDGVWWVELAELTDGATVGEATANAIDVLVEPVRGPIRSVTGYLAARRALVCLDNGEHLLDAVSSLAEAILRACPDVTLCVTSREPLGVAGEAVWRVPPLADDEAVSLFVERAILVRPGFTLDASSEAAVRSIAVQLDGIPLALELAAAWLATLTPQQIEASLDDRFTLLVRGPRGAQRRQQTLAGSIDWSHALLDETDRIVFRRLAAFSGSFGLDMAQAVCAGGRVPADLVLPSVARLVDKSMVIAEEHGAVTRYRMLETIRAYAAARLLEAGEDHAVRDRHLDWAVEFAETNDAVRLRDPDAWRSTMRVEYANLRAALIRGVAADDAHRGRRLAAALAWFWHLDRRGSEGIGLLRRAIERLPEDQSRLQAGLLTGFALVADTASPLDVEYDAATRALELATKLGDESLRALCLNLAAVGAFYTDFDAAWGLCEEAHQAAEASGNTFVLGGSRALQAIILHLRDRHAEAEALIDEPVRGYLGLHRGVLATVLGFQAQGALACGHPARALALADEGLRLAEPLSDYLRVGAARSMLAYVRTMIGDLNGAEAALEPIMRLLDGAADDVFVPWLSQAVGVLALERGDLDRAVRSFSGDAGSTDRGVDTYLAGHALTGLGGTLIALGRHDEARAAFEHAVEVGRRLGMPSVLAEVFDGQAVLAAGDAHDFERAIDLAHAALTERTNHGLQGCVPDSLELLAALGAQVKPVVDDVRLLAASTGARESMGLPRSRRREATVAASLAGLRESLGDHFETAWSEGLKLTLEEAAAYARRTRGTRGRPSMGWASLTPTELEVVHLVAEGRSNPDIAARLFMSRGTVKAHLAHVFTKLDLSNRTELATLAARHLAGYGSDKG